MNSFELQRLTEYIARRKADVYTLTKDELHKVSLRKLSLTHPVIVNLNTSNRNTHGKHWLSFFIYKGDPKHKIACCYFDSYGLDCRDYGIIFPWPITYSNKRQLQTDNSDLCGHFCLAFCYFMLRRREFFESVMYLHFSDSPEKNENRVLELYKSIVKRAEGKLIKPNGYCKVLRCLPKNKALEFRRKK